MTQKSCLMTHILFWHKIRLLHLISSQMTQGTQNPQKPQIPHFQNPQIPYFQNPQIPHPQICSKNYASPQYPQNRKIPHPQIRFQNYASRRNPQILQQIPQILQIFRVPHLHLQMLQTVYRIKLYFLKFFKF